MLENLGLQILETINQSIGVMLLIITICSVISVGHLLLSSSKKNI